MLLNPIKLAYNIRVPSGYFVHYKGFSNNNVKKKNHKCINFVYRYLINLSSLLINFLCILKKILILKKKFCDVVEKGKREGNANRVGLTDTANFVSTYFLCI